MFSQTINDSMLEHELVKFQIYNLKLIHLFISLSKALKCNLSMLCSAMNLLHIMRHVTLSINPLYKLLRNHFLAPFTHLSFECTDQHLNQKLVVYLNIYFVSFYQRYTGLHNIKLLFK